MLSDLLSLEGYEYVLIVRDPKIDEGAILFGPNLTVGAAMVMATTLTQEVKNRVVELTKEDE
jgi:hypothetical protein